MELKSGDVTLRPYRKTDAKRMAILANNEKIERNLRDGFPHPYKLRDALIFISRFKNFPTHFAIEYKGEYVGNIGLTPHENVYRKTAEIGYFIGEPYWNKGIVSTAVKLLTDYGFSAFNFARIDTGVYEYNPASQRVLLKCGYTLEGIFKCNVFKHGELHNEVRFAIINPEVEKGTWKSGE